MKKLIVFVLGFTILLGCKKAADKSETNATQNENQITADGPERTAKQSDGLTLLKGEFLYLADAAVLQTHKEVYAVVIDEKMHELDDMVKSYKTEDTDMVPVEIRGKITQKPEGEEGWPFRVEIKEILNVSEPDKDKSDIIKIGKN